MGIRIALSFGRNTSLLITQAKANLLRRGKNPGESRTSLVLPPLHFGFRGRPFQVMKDVVSVHHRGSGSFHSLVRDQRSGFCTCHMGGWFRRFPRAVMLDMSLAFAKVAKASSSFLVLWACRSLRGDRVHFIDLHRDGRWCQWWSGGVHLHW